MSNDMSIRQMGPKAANKAIAKSISTRRPTFLWGPPGIGKSEVVAQIGEATGREVIDVRLALWEPTDIKGIPYYNSDEGKMTWAPPAELPTDEDSTAIVFLDELNSAPPAVQAAAYQLILNRKVGTYTLPKGVDIVAAGKPLLPVAFAGPEYAHTTFRLVMHHPDSAIAVGTDAIAIVRSQAIGGRILLALFAVRI